MAGKVKELSWSLTRARMFQECPRRFYYHYVYAPLGSVPEAPDDARLAWEMRSVKPLEMWVGEVVHAVIQWALERAKEGNLPTVDEANAEARRRLSEGWKASRDELWRQHGGDEYPNLFQHYYKLPFDHNAIDRMKDRTWVSVANFMNSEVLERICRVPVDNWLPIDRFAAFRVDGLLFYVKLDFALREDGVLRVYDWKTGKPSPEDDRQLTCYAMYASDRWSAPLEEIRVCAAYLQPVFQCEDRTVNVDETSDAREYIHGSFGDMLSCYRDPRRGIAAMEDFPLTGNLKRCVRCSFRGLCPQGAQAGDDYSDVPPDDAYE